MSFSININSRDAIEGLNATKDSLSYYINWSSLSNHTGKWKLSFKFISHQIAGLSNNDIVEIKTDWGANASSYEAKDFTNQNVLNTNIIGLVYTQLNNLITDTNASNPIILNSLPQNNTFKINLKLLDGTPFYKFNDYTTANTSAISTNNTTLTFTAIPSGAVAGNKVWFSGVRGNPIIQSTTATTLVLDIAQTAQNNTQIYTYRTTNTSALYNGDYFITLYFDPIDDSEYE